MPTLILARRHPAAIDLRMVIAMSQSQPIPIKRIDIAVVPSGITAQSLCEEGCRVAQAIWKPPTSQPGAAMIR